MTPIAPHPYPLLDQQWGTADAENYLVLCWDLGKVSFFQPGVRHNAVWHDSTDENFPLSTWSTSQYSLTWFSWWKVSSFHPGVRHNTVWRDSADENFPLSTWSTSQYTLTWFSWWQKVSLPIVCLSSSSISPTVPCDIYLQLDSFYFALKSSTRSHNEFIFLMYWCWDLTKCEFLITRAWLASLLVKSLFVLKLWSIFLDVSPSKKDY